MVAQSQGAVACVGGKCMAAQMTDMQMLHSKKGRHRGPISYQVKW